MSAGSDAVDVTLQWFEETTNRVSEASWFGFAPRVATPPLWEMDKLGTWISPLTVVRDGNRILHAVGTGMRFRGADAEILLETLDAPLLGPGEDSSFRSHPGDRSDRRSSNVKDAGFRFRFTARATYQ